MSSDATPLAQLGKALLVGCACQEKTPESDLLAQADHTVAGTGDDLYGVGLETLEKVPFWGILAVPAAMAKTAVDQATGHDPNAGKKHAAAAAAADDAAARAAAARAAEAEKKAAAAQAVLDKKAKDEAAAAIRKAAKEKETAHRQTVVRYAIGIAAGSVALAGTATVVYLRTRHHR